MSKKGLKALLIILGIVLFIVFYKYKLQEFLTLETLKSNKKALVNYYHANFFKTILAYLLIYVISTAISLPGATVLTLMGGALFGLLRGTILVSFASTIGATLAFLLSRYLFKDYVQDRFADKLKTVNEGIKKDGAFYLFTLRLIPAFPFFAINLVMGLTHIKTSVFFFVSQVGMLLGTIVYVNAGVELSKVESLQDILSPSLIVSFSLLGIFPLIAKRIVEFLKRQRVYKKYKSPDLYDYNTIVIGAGAAGLTTAYICSAVKAKVALIEKHKMGGDCLNTGCVPSKAFLKSAKIAHLKSQATEYGFDEINTKFDFSQIMERIQKLIKKIEPHDSIERYCSLGVDCYVGTAKLLTPWEVVVDERRLTTKNIVIATGAAPFIPSVKGLENINYLTSDTIWNIRALPQKLLVVGAGPVACELSQAFNRFGSKVTIVQRSSRILSKEDSDIARRLQYRLENEGINILTSHQLEQFEVDEDNKYLICRHQDEKVKIEFDQVLFCLGRKANTSGFGLEELGINVRDDGTIEANEYLATNYPNIFVCGDVTGPYQFTHTASHQAWYAAVNSLFGIVKKFKVDYSVIPWCTYTDPEIATVGITEEKARQNNIPYEVFTYEIDDLDRAIVENEDYGVVKVLTVPGKDKILGATIVSSHAGDMLLEFVAAMKHGFGLNKILLTIHMYPTMGEANKYLAGNWKKANVSPKLLAKLKKFHSWRRSKRCC